MFFARASVHGPDGAPLFEQCLTGDRPGLFLHARQGGHQYAHQQRNYGNYNQQFN